MNLWMTAQFVKSTLKMPISSDKGAIIHRHLFCVGRDVFAKYFLVVRPADGDLRPFWVAWAITNLNPNPSHLNQIQIQYWMHNTFDHIDADTDLKEGNVWCEEKGILPCWSHIDCVMTVWKSKVRSGIVDQKMRIPAKQISIIKASLEAYESHSDNE
jgi:hypothetical protein